MICDTHTHILDKRFNDLRERMIADFESDGVAFIVENATSPSDIQDVFNLAQSNDRIYCALGVHPHDSKDYDDATEEKLEQLIKNEKVVALGEIGLDFHYDFSPRDVQQRIFERQISLAVECDVPIVVHSREATELTFDILKDSGAKGVLHSFSGSAQMAEEYVKRGFFISFSGTVTFKNAKKTVEAAKVVPMDRVLCETDCPYLTPEPYRGKTNMPSYVSYVARRLSEIKNIEYKKMQEALLCNARSFFGIEEQI